MVRLLEGSPSRSLLPAERVAWAPLLRSLSCPGSAGCDALQWVGAGAAAAWGRRQWNGGVWVELPRGSLARWGHGGRGACGGGEQAPAGGSGIMALCPVPQPPSDDHVQGCSSAGSAVPWYCSVRFELAGLCEMGWYWQIKLFFYIKSRMTWLTGKLH